MKKYLRQILIPTLLLFPMFVLASNSVDIIHSNQDLFHVNSSDPTVAYLAQLFGAVGNVLHGTSGQLLGHIFKILNVGIMVIAALSFIITIVTTVVHTAHEGRFMGARQSKPAFTILRTVVGFGMLAPLPSGYSMIQVLSMSIILHGVGFANAAWNVALDYFNDGGVVLMPPSTNTANSVNLAGTVLQAQICMYHQEKEAIDEQTKEGGPFVHGFVPHFEHNTVRFPANSGNKASDAGCGEFTWDSGVENKDNYLQAAMRQVIYDTGMVAKYIAYPQDYVSSHLRQSTEAAVIGGAADWISYTLPVRGKRSEEVQKYLQKARERGWIFAGAYYYGLTSLQRHLDDESRWQFVITKPIRGINACSTGSCDMINFPERPEDFRRMINPTVTSKGSPTLMDSYVTAADYVGYAIKKAKDLDKKTEGGDESIITPDSGHTPISLLINPFMTKFNVARQALFGNPATNMDPVIQLQAAGSALMSIMTIVWVGTAVLIFFISGGLSWFSSVSSWGFAFRDMLNFFLPIFMMMCVICFVQGIVMALYIPMIPFIIFTFSVIGWFAVTVETLVAAPLVALGLAHHEGHDMWGRSEEAIWLLLNVFLRPILMVIGLLAGMLLSRLALKFLNIGFAQVSSDIHKASYAFAAVGEMMMYVMLVTTVIHVSYSLIHRIPDKVMRWLRSGGDQMSEFVGQASKGAQDGMQQAGQQRAKMGDQAQMGGRYTASAIESKNRHESNRKQQLSAGNGGSSGSGSGGGRGMSNTGNAKKQRGTDLHNLNNQA